MMTYRCPKCGAEVPMKNINVEKDLMLCPSCGVTSAFSEVVEPENGYIARLSEKPPKHLTVVAEIEPNDVCETVTATYRRIVPGATLFLVIFSCFWVGGSMFGIYGTQIMKHQFDLKISLFGIPFVIGSIFLISTCLFALFGKRVLRLKRGNGSFFSGVGPIGKTVRFTYNRATKVTKGNSNYYVNGRTLPRLELTNPDSLIPVKICTGLDEDALEYVYALLQRECKRM